MNFFETCFLTRLRKYSVVLALLVALLIWPALTAQQRMGFARGTFGIGPNSAESVPTYCLDWTRESPHAGTQYRQVLTNPGSAHVTIGGNTFTLQQALDRQLIAVEGQDPTFEQFINTLRDPIALQRMRLTPRQRAAAQELAALWNQANADERQQVESMFGPMFQGLGDHTHLRFVNKSGERATISFDENTILGHDAEPVGDVDADTFAASATREHDSNVQKGIWIANTRKHQQMLKDLGFYPGVVDGLPGPQTRKALTAFQEGSRISATGEFDKATLASLSQQAASKIADDRALSELRRQTGQIVVAVGQDSAGRYSLNRGDGTPIIATNDMSQLASAINQELLPDNVTSLSVDLTNVGGDNAEVVASSLRIQQRRLNRSVSISAFYHDPSDTVDAVLFSKGVRVEEESLKTEQVVEGARRGWFRTTLEFTVRAGSALKQVTMRFFAKTASLARDFGAFVLSRFKGGQLDAALFDNSLTPLQLVELTLQDYRRSHPDLKPGDIAAELGSSQIVDLVRYCLECA